MRVSAANFGNGLISSKVYSVMLFATVNIPEYTKTFKGNAHDRLIQWYLLLCKHLTTRSNWNLEMNKIVRLKNLFVSTKTFLSRGLSIVNNIIFELGEVFYAPHLSVNMNFTSRYRVYPICCFSFCLQEVMQSFSLCSAFLLPSGSSQKLFSV